MMMYTLRLIGRRDYFGLVFNALLFSPSTGISEGLKESIKVSVLIDCLGVFIGLSLRSV